MARPCHAQTGRACPLCRYFRHKRIVDLDPEIPNGALDFCMAETLAEDPGRTQPELLIPGAAAQYASGLPGRNSARILGSRASSAGASPPRSWPTPELRIPNAAAQTRIISKARIRFDQRK